MQPRHTSSIVVGDRIKLSKLGILIKVLKKMRAFIYGKKCQTVYVNPVSLLVLGTKIEA